jgi:hypothetical protein
MDIYSIQFIAKPQKGGERTWALSQCSDMVKVQKRLRSLRQLVTGIAGPSSDILTELSDVKNILEHCNPTWTRSITIAEARAYTFFIRSQDKAAFITAKAQGKIIHHIGLTRASDMKSYQNVIGFMRILIRLLEGMNSSNEDWVNDMAVGKTKPCQDWGDDTEIESLFNIFANLQQPQARPKITSHPSEITIYASPTSYEIIITKH